MFGINWKRDIGTVPNLLSLIRLFCIPVYLIIYLNANSTKQYIYSAVILTFSCLTDAADGFIARKYHMTSNLGKILDPLADKLTQLSLTLCLSMKYPVLYPVLILFLLKELGQILGAILLVKKGCPIPESNAAGKICTAVLFTSLILLVLFPSIPELMVDGIALIDSLFLIYTFLTYYMIFWNKPNKANFIDES